MMNEVTPRQKESLNGTITRKSDKMMH